MAAEADLESTATLLSRVRAGDEDARERLMLRYLALLKRWAHGRVPPRARGLTDTDDLVQTTLVRALNGVQHFEPRREGAFLAYLRTILLNQLRTAIKRVDAGPLLHSLPEGLAGARPSPLEEAIGAEAIESYEAALASLTEDQRQAVVLRIEMELTFQQVAEAMESPSVDAARMLVARGLARLSERMIEHTS
ncbi:MAG: sigma-70 family RNA polymerase sigma factor [Deltaproteobacteria bacterium]|nr:sigma-70 family RNA polymerase sigma factor [Deltaproteobacteria bacterium]